MADRDHQLEVLVGEAPWAALRHLRQGYGGVDIQHADGPVTPLHRHADRFVDAGPEHAVAAAEALVVLGVAGQHPFGALDHVVEDRAADGHRAGGSRPAVAARRGTQRARRRIEEHDAAPVGLDPFEHEVQDPRQQLVDVERVADGEGRPVHHLEVATRPGEPAVVGVAGWRTAGRGALFAERPHDPRAVVGTRRSDDVHHTGRGIRVSVHREQQQRAADLNLVAAGQLRPFNAPAVDERAVGTLQVGDDVAGARGADFGVPARHLPVLELHGIPRLPADSDRRGPRQWEPSSAIGPLDHEQRRHRLASEDSPKGIRPGAGFPGSARDTLPAYPSVSPVRDSPVDRGRGPWGGDAEAALPS